MQAKIHPFFDAPGITEEHMLKVELMAGIFSVGSVQVLLEYQEQHAISRADAIDQVYALLEDGVVPSTIEAGA